VVGGGLRAAVRCSVGGGWSSGRECAGCESCIAAPSLPFPFPACARAVSPGTVLAALWTAVAGAGRASSTASDAVGPLLHAVVKLAVTAAGGGPSNAAGAVALADVLTDVRDVLEVRGDAVPPAMAHALRCESRVDASWERHLAPPRPVPSRPCLCTVCTACSRPFSVPHESPPPLRTRCRLGLSRRVRALLWLSREPPPVAQRRAGRLPRRGGWCRAATVCSAPRGRCGVCGLWREQPGGRPHRAVQRVVAAAGGGRGLAARPLRPAGVGGGGAERRGGRGACLCVRLWCVPVCDRPCSRRVWCHRVCLNGYTCAAASVQLSLHGCAHTLWPMLPSPGVHCPAPPRSLRPAVWCGRLWLLVAARRERSVRK
jgi:hypothetical protein